MKKLFLILIAAFGLLFTACDAEEEKVIDNQTEIPADTNDPVIDDLTDDIPDNEQDYFALGYKNIKAPVCCISYVKYYEGLQKRTYYWKDGTTTDEYIDNLWGDWYGMYFCLDDLDHIDIKPAADNDWENYSFSSDLFTNFINNNETRDVYYLGLDSEGGIDFVSPYKFVEGLFQSHPIFPHPLLYPVHFYQNDITDDITSFRVEYIDECILPSLTFSSKSEFCGGYFEAAGISSIILQLKSFNNPIQIKGDSILKVLGISPLPIDELPFSTGEPFYDIYLSCDGNNIYGEATSHTPSLHKEIHLDPVLLATIEE